MKQLIRKKEKKMDNGARKGQMQVGNMLLVIESPKPPQWFGGLFEKFSLKISFSDSRLPELAFYSLSARAVRLDGGSFRVILSKRDCEYIERMVFERPTFFLGSGFLSDVEVLFGFLKISKDGLSLEKDWERQATIFAKLLEGMVCNLVAKMFLEEKSGKKLD